MKQQLPGWVERSRIKSGPMASYPGTGPNGAFLLRFKEPNRSLVIIASDGQGWDHVSVRVANDDSDLPTWTEMTTIKKLFFHPHECTYQYHPKEEDYINFHPGVLHMWRPHLLGVPTPPTWMIGPKGTPWLGGEKE